MSKGVASGPKLVSDKLTYQKYTTPSPQRVDNRTLSTLEVKDHKNNILAYEVQTALYAIMTHPDYYDVLRRWARVNIQRLRGMAFDGFFPLDEHFEDLEKSLKGKTGEIHNRVRDCRKNLEEKILDYEIAWYHLGLDRYEKHKAANALAVSRFIQDNGGRFAMFGSARYKEGSPAYSAAQWLAQTIVESFPQDDGSTELVITGAGPGIMEAGSKGAMEGGWNHLQSKIALREKEGSSPEIDAQVIKARKQMISVGTRIELPFETGWNTHLSLNISLNEFPGRKQSLILAAAGQKMDSFDEQAYEWHGRHPAVFVFPGGFGTEDEAWDVACQLQCGKMPHIPLIVIGDMQRESIEQRLETMEDYGTISPGDRKNFIFCRDEREALQRYIEWHSLEPSEDLQRKMKRYVPTMRELENAPDDSDTQMPNPVQQPAAVD